MLVHFVVALPLLFTKHTNTHRGTSGSTIWWQSNGKPTEIRLHEEPKYRSTGGRMRNGTRNNESNFNNNYHFSCIAAKC